MEIAAIPMNYVISAGFHPLAGLYFESREAPFALMIIASRADNAKRRKGAEIREGLSVAGSEGIH